MIKKLIIILASAIFLTQLPDSIMARGEGHHGAGLLPAAIIAQYYGGYYPYFGYGLGLSQPAEQTLVTYIDNQKWSQAEEILINRSNELQNQLTTLNQDIQANRQQIIDTQDQLTKVQLHIDAMSNHLNNQQPKSALSSF